MQKARKNTIQGIFMLTIASVIWGSAFVAQSTGAEHVGAFTFITFRSFLGAAALLPVIFVRERYKKKNSDSQEQKMSKADKKYLLIAGVVCGVVLTVATSLQQIGLTQGTAPGKAGFITSFYMLMVPIFSIVLKKKVRPLIWACSIVALCGLYLLCVTQQFTIESSDFIVFLCAIAFTFHIMVIDKVSPRVDGVKLSCIQFFIAGCIATIPMLLTETIVIADIKEAAFSIVYAGVMSSGVAFTLQILAQQRIDPTIASMLMSLESVFAIVTEIIILGTAPTTREAIGCTIIFAAIIVSQIPKKKKSNLDGKVVVNT